MKICMVCMDYPPIARGIGYQVYDLSKKLVERRHEVIVLTRGTYRGTRQERMEGIDVFRVRFMPLYPFHLHIHGIFLNKILDKILNVDVVHLHTPLLPFVKTSLPQLATVAAPAITGIRSRENKDLQSIGLKIFSKIFVDTEKKLLMNSDRITTVSNSSKAELKYFYGIDADVVPIGIDLSLFTPPRVKRNDLRNILYVGAFNGLKGLPTLVAAAKKVCKEEKDVNFIMVGKGPLENFLRKMVIKNRLEQYFHFAGYVPRSQLINYYHNATIFVLPSLHEGLPLSLREAMACGVPCISTDVPGASEIIDSGTRGLIVPPRNSEKLAEAILFLLNNEETRWKMAKNGRKIIEERFDLERTVNRYIEIYEEILYR